MSLCDSDLDEDEAPFPYRQVNVRKDKWVTDEFEILGFLGRGKFGEVKRCCEISSGREFAAKFICASRPQDKKEVEHEINIMKKLRNNRIIQLYDAFECKTEMCLVLEIIYGGELFDRVISEDFILTEKACLCFVRQICEGIAYMHSSNIIHLDMKPENILCLTRTGNRVKIIDFGLAREWHPKKDLRVLFGTPEFMAPEVVQYEPITFATDMWSVGVICYVLLSGLSPFMGDTDADTLQNVIDGDYDFDYPEFEHISSEAKDLVSKLLLRDKSKRLTATECLQHPWLQKRHEPKTPTLELSKRRLKTFVYRRKWQKIVNAIIALKRMGVQIHMLRRSSVSMLETGASIVLPEVMAVLEKETEPDNKVSNQLTPAKQDGIQHKPAKKATDKSNPSTSSKQPRKKVENKQIVSNCVVNDKISEETPNTNSDQGISGAAETSSPTVSQPPVKSKKPALPTNKPKTKPKEPKGSLLGKILKPKSKEKKSSDKDDKDVFKPSKTGLSRDNSLRRSTKIPKHGPKTEQYVSVEKQLAQLKLTGSSVNSTSNSRSINPSKDGTVSPCVSNDLTKINNDLGAAASSLEEEETSKDRKGSIKSGFSTFSRVRDRIKFLEQKDTGGSDTKKKGKIKNGSGRAS